MRVQRHMFHFEPAASLCRAHSGVMLHRRVRQKAEPDVACAALTRLTSALSARILIEMKSVGLVVACSCCLFACIPSRTRARSQRTVQITLHSVLVGPAKGGGLSWDGEQQVGDDVLHASSEAGGEILGLTQPAVVIAAIVTGYLLDSTTKPDVFGHADVMVGSRRVVRIELEKQDNTFSPRWDHLATGVPWTNSTHLVVMLTDADPLGDDAIATVNITRQELQNALTDGKVRFVPVGDQSANQLLFVAVSVTAEGWSPKPLRPIRRAPRSTDASLASADTGVAPPAIERCADLKRARAFTPNRARRHNARY